MGATLKGAVSGLTFVYSSQTQLTHGAPSTLLSPPVTGRIVRVHGSFAVATGGRAGYWGHLTFSTSNGVNITVSDEGGGRPVAGGSLAEHRGDGASCGTASRTPHHCHASARAVRHAP